jgi:hypothetical protein
MGFKINLAEPTSKLLENFSQDQMTGRNADYYLYRILYLKKSEKLGQNQ